MMNSRYLNTISLTLILSLVFVSCKQQGEKLVETEDVNGSGSQEVFISVDQFETNGMKMEKMIPSGVSESIRVSGIIDVPPQSIAVLTAIRGGYIRDIPYLVGDQVKKGQALVTLENPEYLDLQQHYLETKEQLSYLKAEYDRQKTLIEENITSQKNFLKAESEYKSAQARATGLRKQLLMLNIDPSRVEAGTLSPAIRLYAPIKGGISKIHVTKGMFVSPTMEILEVVDLSHIHLELNVFEKDIPRLRIGQDITFTIPEISQRSHEAEVYLIGNALEENRTVRVHAHLKDDPDISFIRGMFVDAEIRVADEVAGDSPESTLPESAVIESDGAYFVLRLSHQDENGYTFSKVEVTPGMTRENRTTIESGTLDMDDLVLTVGAFDVMPQ